MKKIGFYLLFLIPAACTKSTGDSPNPPALTDAVYKNGILSTGNVSNSGVTAPAGYNWSEAQHTTGNTSLSNVLLGIACYYDAFSNYKSADDFIVPVGQTWNISKVSVYAFAGSGTTNPFDVLRIQLWKGNPSVAGSVLVAGDLTTNVLSSSIDSMTYAIQNSAVPAPGVTPATSIPIWKLTANITATLQPGNYWLVWQTHTSTGTSGFSPPVKIKGLRGLPGWNAIVYSSSITAWQAAFDTGIPFTPPTIPQDLPFEIVYKY
jgi:hypothetical protein